MAKKYHVFGSINGSMAFQGSFETIEECTAIDMFVTNGFSKPYEYIHVYENQVDGSIENVGTYLLNAVELDAHYG